MKTKETVLTATEFKAKCLKVFDELDARGIVVTKRGRPVARVTLFSPATFEKFYGSMKGKIVVKGDIFSTGMKWHAQS